MRISINEYEHLVGDFIGYRSKFENVVSIEALLNLKFLKQVLAQLYYTQTLVLDF